MTGVLVDCPCCSGSGEHGADAMDPREVMFFACRECEATGRVTPQAAQDWRVWAAERTDGTPVHLGVDVPADPFLGPQDAEPF